MVRQGLFVRILLVSTSRKHTFVPGELAARYFVTKPSLCGFGIDVDMADDVALGRLASADRMAG